MFGSEIKVYKKGGIILKIFNLNDMSNEQKNDMFSFFDQMLVNQAVTQHLQNDEDLGLKGGVVSYEVDRENECLFVKYKNGEIWRYRNISFGAESMTYKLVQGDE